MKCPNCGNTDCFSIYIERIPYAGGGGVEGLEPQYSPFVCSKCGYIMFFYNERLLREHNTSPKEKEEKVKAENEKDMKIQKEIESIQKEIEELLIIINDKNKSIKEIMEAKEKLDSNKKKLRGLEVSLQHIHITPNGPVY